MDFTLSSYKQLISAVQAQSFFFQTFEEFIQNPKEKVLILRHDVDRLPGNSLKTARMENRLGIRASYYFRTIPQTFKTEIIKEIAGLGHEIGYHYENLSEISKKHPQITQITRIKCLAQRRKGKETVFHKGREFEEERRA